MTDETWTEINQPWSEFSRRSNRVGLLVEVHSRNGAEAFLIGDINDMGGVCDDCRVVYPDDVVLRARRVYTEGA